MCVCIRCGANEVCPVCTIEEQVCSLIEKYTGNQFGLTNVPELVKLIYRLYPKDESGE